MASNLVVVTDLYSLKYNQSEGDAIRMLNQIIVTPKKSVGLIVPDSIIHLCPNTWTKTNQGQAYKSQGLTEDAWVVIG